MTKVTFRALPPAQFANLQKRVFPAYFKLQVGLAVLAIITIPTRDGITSRLSLWRSSVSLAANLALALLNQWVYGPRTISSMIQRNRQGQ